MKLNLGFGYDIVKGGFILKDGIMSCSDQPGVGSGDGLIHFESFKIERSFARVSQD